MNYEHLFFFVMHIIFTMTHYCALILVISLLSNPIMYEKKKIQKEFYSNFSMQKVFICCLMIRVQVVFSIISLYWLNPRNFRYVILRNSLFILSLMSIINEEKHFLDNEFIWNFSCLGTFCYLFYIKKKKNVELKERFRNHDLFEDPVHMLNFANWSHWTIFLCCMHWSTSSSWCKLFV